MEERLTCTLTHPAAIQTQRSASFSKPGACVQLFMWVQGLCCLLVLFLFYVGVGGVGGGVGGGRGGQCFQLFQVGLLPSGAAGQVRLWAWWGRWGVWPGGTVGAASQGGGWAECQVRGQGLQAACTCPGEGRLVGWHGQGGRNIY